MKRLITLILLLLAPALARATDPCMQGCQLFITAGTMTVDNGHAFWNASGPHFTTSGGWNFEPTGGLHCCDNLTPGDAVGIHWGGNADSGDLFMSVTMDNGFGYSTPNGAQDFSTSNVTINGAGTYKAPFSWDGAVFDLGCSPCSVFLKGQGIATLFVEPQPGTPGLFYVPNSIFTFKAPEPSTASLLLLGFAGLAILGWRRNVRAALLGDSGVAAA